MMDGWMDGLLTNTSGSFGGGYAYVRSSTGDSSAACLLSNNARAVFIGGRIGTIGSISYINKRRRGEKG